MIKGLTIAGSDSSGGAGIQSDIKTFASLGVFATTIITALTAQNTKTVTEILAVQPKFFENQLVTTLEDIKPDVIKIGVLYDSSIIDIVYNVLKATDTPIIVDPILVSGTGVKLIKDQAFKIFKKKIIPLSLIITPNQAEAQALSEIKITYEKELIESAFKIINLGTKNVIIKGFYDPIKNDRILDILIKKEGQEIIKIYNKRLDITEIHGTGCNFSASLAAFISKGYNIDEAFFHANSYVKESLHNTIRIGSGNLVINPLYKVYEMSEKFKIKESLQMALDSLYEIKKFYLLIPETKSNFVFSLEKPQTSLDVAGILGRITTIGNRVRFPNIIKFGASTHVSSAIIEANKFNHSFRSAINIKNNKEILDICKSNFICSFYSRSDEPKEIKNIEGNTIKWGINEVFKKQLKAEVVYHDGDIGKEPMIIIFGKDPIEIIGKINIIISKMNFN